MSGPDEYEKLRLRYAGKPFCGTVSEIWDANSDLDWTAIRKYAQSQGVHLKELLPRDGILISPKDQIIAIVQELAGRYPDADQRPLSLEQLQRDNPALDLQQLGADIERELRQKGVRGGASVRPLDDPALFGIALIDHLDTFGKLLLAAFDNIFPDCGASFPKFALDDIPTDGHFFV